MQGEPDVVVLRLGHRAGRDERMTSHVGLTARAFGADRVIIPEIASEAATTLEDITRRFGGPFQTEIAESPESVLTNWEDTIVHLTMYGEPIQDVIGDVRSAHTDPLLIVVGGGKVAGSIYELADWNIGVTNQPHSEVAALALFLDRLFDGREFDRTWVAPNQRVVPQRAGKRIDDVD